MTRPTDLQTDIVVLLFKQEPLIYELIVGSKEGLVFLFYSLLNVVRLSLWNMVKLHEFSLFFWCLGIIIATIIRMSQIFFLT